VSAAVTAFLTVTNRECEETRAVNRLADGVSGSHYVGVILRDIHWITTAPTAGTFLVVMATVRIGWVGHCRRSRQAERQYQGRRQCR
jgi:hypothetical protein